MRRRRCRVPETFQLTAAAYSRNAATGVWERPGFTGLPYSDGEEVEARLLAAVNAARDVSAASLELRAHIVDWPSEYHFSPARHNLLRALRFGAGDRVLELGCGCGAITRYLGERGAQVLAVDGSLRRAQIAAARCRDLPDVRVACDNLTSFDTPERFDVVTLIGVLEYSRRFIEAPDPVLECLRRARGWLADDGVLVLAIENRLGLKYFAGCGEDHVGRPYAGIEDLYGERTAVTFGRRELGALLGAAGLPSQEWYFPFPDYKVPDVLLSEHAFGLPGFDVPALLFRSRSRDYGGNPLRVFDEALARRQAWKNGVLAELANSFLVVASPRTVPSRGGGELASAFNVSRYPRYWTAARFHEQNGAIRVARAHLEPQTPVPAARFSHQLADEPYVAGPLLVESLHRLARRGWGVDAIAQWALPWLALLKDHALPDRPRELPPRFLDCTPFNCIVGPDGRLAYIDAEWSADSPVPLAWVFIRGLSHALEMCLAPAPLAARREILEQVALRIGPPLTPADFERAEEWELALQAQCRPQAELRRYYPVVERDAFAEMEGLRQALHTTLNSRSMRLTQPLRSGIALLRRLRR